MWIITAWQSISPEVTVKGFNTLRTGVADLRLYITTVQDG